MARLSATTLVAALAVLLASHGQKADAAFVALDFQTDVEGCNNKDVSARGVVEQCVYRWLA
jgi:hypothetical protein